MTSMTREQLITACGVPDTQQPDLSWLDSPTDSERLATLEMFLNSAFESAVTDVLDLLNRPDMECPFPGVTNWRDAYIEQAKRHIRQIAIARYCASLSKS